MEITTRNIHRASKEIEIPLGMRLHIQATRQDLEDTEIVVRPNYYDGFGAEAHPPIRTGLGTYLADTTTTTFPANDLCPEMPIPESLAQYIQLQLASSVQAGSHAIALLHAGRENCIAPMHFDWDHDNVLHVCVSGTRTFFLFPPDAGWLLSPVINTSALCLARFSEKDQRALLEKLGGQKIVLRPGEAVLFPSMWWHCVYYDEASVGISVRFADRADLRPFSVLPRSWWLQRVVWELFRKKIPPAEVEKILLECSNIFFAEYPTWQDRYSAFTTWCREYLLRMHKQDGSQYWIDDAFNPELALAEFELEELYTLPGNAKRGQEFTDIKDFLFESFPALKSMPVADALTQYALSTRNGLPAKRGLIPIQYEKSSE